MDKIQTLRTLTGRARRLQEARILWLTFTGIIPDIFVKIFKIS